MCIYGNTGSPAPSEGSPAPSDDEDYTGAIIGGTIVGILFIIVVLVLATIIVIWRKRTHNKNYNNRGKYYNDDVNTYVDTYVDTHGN